MRVVHLESGRHLYGGAQQVCGLITGLAAEGIENVLICPRDSAIANTVGRMDRAAEVIEIPMRVSRISCMSTRAAARTTSGAGTRAGQACLRF